MDRVLRISAISGPTNISISGPWSDLRDFKKLLGSPANASFAHVHGWYHGGEYFTSIVDKVMQDVQDRHVRYPCITDIVKPIRSSFDGTILDVKDRDDLKLDNWVVRHLLVYHTDWERTAQNIVSRIQEISLSGGDVLTQLVSFGPSSQLLFDEIRRKNAAPSIVVVDCSPFEMAKKNLFEPSSQEGIAIVGMGMNLPGGRTPSEMWETLSKAKDMLKEVWKSLLIAIRILRFRTSALGC